MTCMCTFFFACVFKVLLTYKKKEYLYFQHFIANVNALVKKAVPLLQPFAMLIGQMPAHPNYFEHFEHVSRT